MMHEPGKSDSNVVPAKLPNKAGLSSQGPAAEVMEGRTLAEGNSPKQNTSWFQSQGGVQSALARIRTKARAEKGLRFTSLMHVAYAEEALREAFYSLKKQAAAGVDGVTNQRCLPMSAPRHDSDHGSQLTDADSGALVYKPRWKSYIACSSPLFEVASTVSSGCLMAVKKKCLTAKAITELAPPLFSRQPQTDRQKSPRFL